MSAIGSFYHRSQEPWVFNLSKIGSVEIVFRVEKSSINTAKIHWMDSQWGTLEDFDGNNSILMSKAGSTDLHDYYSVRLFNKTKRFRYVFEIKDDENSYFISSAGVSYNLEPLCKPSESFYWEYANINNDLDVKQWYKDTNWYQIFPDRFCRVGDKDKFVSWDIDIPKGHEIYGGNFDGVILKLNYIKSLGFTGIYFTPVFEAKTSHRYETHDYLKIDPILGDDHSFKKLIDKAHELGIRIMLDGVFNHIGYHSPQFQDVILNKEKSKYKDWFIIHDYSALTNDLKSLKKDKRFIENYPYETFSFSPEMPRLNTDNNDVRKHMKKIIDKWTSMGIDGWRLDVSFEPSFDFWRWFSRRAKMVNPELVIIGEVWWDSIKWLQKGVWDGVMNYILRDCIIEYFTSDFSEEAQLKFVDKYNTYVFMYTPKQHWGMFNLLSSHDVERFYTTINQNNDLFKNANKLMFSLPGSTSTYYGEENGMEGSQDPDNRRPMDWERDTVFKDFFNGLINETNKLYNSDSCDNRMVASMSNGSILITNEYVEIKIDGPNVSFVKSKLMRGEK